MINQYQHRRTESVQHYGEQIGNIKTKVGMPWCIWCICGVYDFMFLSEISNRGDAQMSSVSAFHTVRASKAKL